MSESVRYVATTLLAAVLTAIANAVQYSTMLGRTLGISLILAQLVSGQRRYRSLVL
jgi:hypothetical protein